MRTEEEWEEVREHLDEVITEYGELIDTPGVNVSLALNVVLYPLKMRFEAGERTEQLYESMLNTE